MRQGLLQSPGPQDPLFGNSFPASWSPEGAGWARGSDVGSVKGMTAFQSSVADRLLTGKGRVQIGARLEEPGERGGVSQAPAGALLGTRPLGRAGAGPRSSRLCMLSKGLGSAGRKSELVPFRSSHQGDLKPEPGVLHKAASTPVLPVPFPSHSVSGGRLPTAPVCPGQPMLTGRRKILNSGNAN